MSISLKSIADKTNKYKETLKDLEVQNKEYWLSSLYTLLECPKIIAEHFVSCAQNGLYECRVSRGWLYSEIKKRNESFDLSVESGEFVLVYLFCLKNIIETYAKKYNVLCYGMFCFDGDRYITPELKVNWEDSKTKNDNTNSGLSDTPYTTGFTNCLVLTAISLVGVILFSVLRIGFLVALSAISTIVFLIGFVCFAVCLCFRDFEELNNYTEINVGKNANNDIKQFYDIYESLLTITKESELKETYSRIIDTL